MKAEQLLQFKDIVIQCHNDPDADAIASGYGIYLYLQEHGIKARLIYGGKNAIQKSNLALMVKHLEIPIEHMETLEKEPELLLLVDCQYKEKNVQEFTGKTIAVIDHHKAKTADLPDLRDVRDNYGSCATIVWDMLCQSDFYSEENKKKRPAGLDERLSTALYYGLYMDTSRMQELRHPKDKDLRDALEFCCNQNALFLFRNNNLSLEELAIAGEALAAYDYREEYRFAVVEAKKCDPNILGVISDLLIEVDAVDTCIVYCMRGDGAKLSVRSCVKETRANELAEYICGGGGHPQKAGGFMKESLVRAEYEEKYGAFDELQIGNAVHRLLTDRMSNYFKEQEFIYAGTKSTPDLTAYPLYQKKRLPIGYVRAADLYPVGTKVSVRMMEGDIAFTVAEDTYFMIGVESEVYKNDEAYFLSHNDLSDEPYVFKGEYAPVIHETVKAVGVESKSLKDYAKTCIPKASSFIHAREVTKRTKVFVPWSDNYMLGEPGDYLAARQENPKDVYIIKKGIFKDTYQQAQ